MRYKKCLRELGKYTKTFVTGYYILQSKHNHRLKSINVQQDATIHSLFYLQTALHVSSGFSTHHQEHK